MTAYMRFTDFIHSHCLVIRCTTMLWQHTLINAHQVGILLFWELANNNILNTIPIGMASYQNTVLKIKILNNFEILVI